MRIWTTPQLAAILLEDELPAKLISEKEIKNEFLNNAVTGDIALLPFDEDYMEFLAFVKAKGIQCPTIFITPEPTILQENIHLYNAIVFDMKRIGSKEVRHIVNFIIRNMPEEGSADFQYIPPVPDIEWEQTPDERSVHSSSEIQKVLIYKLKEGSPVIIAFQIPERDILVTARGICNIKDMNDDSMVLYRFKPLVVPKGLKKGGMIKIFLSHINKNYEALIKTLNVTEDMVVTSVPEIMFTERRRYVRVEPGPVNPVILNMHIQNEPTISLKVTDISLHGIGFYSTRDLKLGNIYFFSIILPEPQSVVISYGIIRFKKELKDSFQYGVELKIHPKDEEHISQYIMKREFEITKLLRDM
ncbi:MAG: PilZ domain-containing protein [Nitrospira sp.]|nr:PilZ domain-containing protein [Nitrospira sp.]